MEMKKIYLFMFEFFNLLFTSAPRVCVCVSAFRRGLFISLGKFINFVGPFSHFHRVLINGSLLLRSFSLVDGNGLILCLEWFSGGSNRRISICWGRKCKVDLKSAKFLFYFQQENLESANSNFNIPNKLVTRFLPSLQHQTKLSPLQLKCSVSFRTK